MSEMSHSSPALSPQPRGASPPPPWHSQCGWGRGAPGVRQSLRRVLSPHTCSPARAPFHSAPHPLPLPSWELSAGAPSTSWEAQPLPPGPSCLRGDGDRGAGPQPRQPRSPRPAPTYWRPGPRADGGCRRGSGPGGAPPRGSPRRRRVGPGAATARSPRAGGRALPAARGAAGAASRCAGPRAPASAPRSGAARSPVRGARRGAGWAREPEGCWAGERDGTEKFEGEEASATSRRRKATQNEISCPLTVPMVPLGWASATHSLERQV